MRTGFILTIGRSIAEGKKCLPTNARGAFTHDLLIRAIRFDWVRPFVEERRVEGDRLGWIIYGDVYV